MAAPGATTGSEVSAHDAVVRTFPEKLGHPAPLWMLFMTEFWERFAFYGIRWALAYYFVAQFFNGDPVGEKPAGITYGAYLALVYASGMLGGYVADRILGYQRSILLGAVIMSVGLLAIAIPDQRIFEIGLATIIIGNGLFKPNISSMVGKLYATDDSRRDAGFTIFYMGINAGAFIAPIVTQVLAKKFFGTEAGPAYKYVFIASAVGMLISFVWFWFGRRQLHDIGRAPEGNPSRMNVLYVLVGALLAIPVAYFLLASGDTVLAWILGVMFLCLCGLLLFESMRDSKVQRDMVIAMLIIFAFNVLFWMFFEQAGSSFSFLSDKIVNRDIFSGWVADVVNALSGERAFPNSWFQSVNSTAIIALAPLVAFFWVWMARRNKEPSIPRKFGLGLIFNGLAFLLLMYALTYLVDPANKIPFWTLFMVYVIQSVGELCLSPIGLSMVTKLAPPRLVGFAMGGWFLSVANGNNLSGKFAGWVSGEGGMTTSSALAGYTVGFWCLIGSGVLLFLISPLINKLMHGVR